MGFPFGGWQAPLLDEVAGAQVGAAYEGTDALLLGRRTYDIFAAYWPYQEGGEDNEVATLFNSVPKYVASRGRPDLSGRGSQRRRRMACAVRDPCRRGSACAAACARSGPVRFARDVTQAAAYALTGLRCGRTGSRSAPRRVHRGRMIRRIHRDV